MAARILLLAALVVSITCSDIAFAFDPSPLQDFCVADLQKPGGYSYLILIDKINHCILNHCTCN